MYAFRTPSTGWPWQKKWKLITSSLTPESEEGSIVRLIGLNRAPSRLPFPRVFLLFFFFVLSSFFFLFLSPPLPFFSHFQFYRDRYHRSCFFWTRLMTHNERWLRCSLCGGRGGEKGQGVGYLADKVLLSMPPRGKEGIYLDVEEKESAFRGFEGRVK